MQTGLTKVKALVFVGMTCALVMSIRNVPDVAATGWTLFFYLIIASLMYALPVTLISGEFGGMFTKGGGPELWTTNSLNKKWGFVTSWLLWVQMFPGMVMVSSVLAPLLGYIIGDDSLGLNNVATVVLILIVYWIVTILNLIFDMAKFGGKFGTWLGVYIPFITLVVLGIFALGKAGITPQSTLGTFEFYKLFPHEGIEIFPSGNENASTLQYFAPIIFIYSGIEMSSVYIPRLVKPALTYVRGIFIALILMFAFNTVSGFLVAGVVANGQMELNNITQGIVLYLDILGLPHWIANVFALCVFIGVAVQLSAWASGPSKTITGSARRGQYPPKWKYWKTNKFDVAPTVILTQAVIISIFSFVFLLGSSVNAAFLMLVNSTTVIYCIVYVIMGVGILRLRKTQPDLERPFRVGGKNSKGNGALWFVVIILFVTIAAAVILTLITSSLLNFWVVIIITAVLFFAPLIIASRQKDEWVDIVNAELAKEHPEVHADYHAPVAAAGAAAPSAASSSDASDKK